MAEQPWQQRGRTPYKKPAGKAAPAAAPKTQPGSFEDDELVRVTGLFQATRKDGSFSQNVLEIISKEEITIPAGVVLKVLITSEEKRKEGKPVATLCYKILG